MFIHPLIKILIVSTFCLSRIVLLLTLCASICWNTCFQFSKVSTQLWNHMPCDNSTLNFLRNHQTFFREADPFYIPTINGLIFACCYCSLKLFWIRVVFLVDSMILSIFRIEKLLLNRERRHDSWPLEEKNSIRGQRRGLIAQSFCVIKFYSSIKGIEKASDIDIRRGQKEYPPASLQLGVI